MSGPVPKAHLLWGILTSMSDELTIEGKSYVSSKRASDLSAYTQDYIGQLARAGYIDVQRIGGLWYVSMTSLLEYKEKGEREKSPPPQPHIFRDPESLVFFDGKQFISASRASKLTAYTQDYVGQLARSGKILSRQVGNRWYVEHEGILKHKKEKDALLAAVQTHSVGILASKSGPISAYNRENSIQRTSDLHFTYIQENGDLVPVLPEKDTSENQSENDALSDEVYSVPIRVIESRPRNTFQSDHSLDITPSGRRKVTLRGINPKLLRGLIATVVVVLSIGGFSIWGASMYAANSSNSSLSSSTREGVFTAAVAKGLEQGALFLERWIAPEILYKR